MTNPSIARWQMHPSLHKPEVLFVVLTPQPPPGYCAIIHVDHSTAVVLMLSRRQLSSPLHNQNDKNIHFLQQSICISFYFHFLCAAPFKQSQRLTKINLSSAWKKKGVTQFCVWSPAPQLPGTRAQRGQLTTIEPSGTRSYNGCHRGLPLAVLWNTLVRNTLLWNTILRNTLVRNTPLRNTLGCP